jgi:hypothetical protein
MIPVGAPTASFSARRPTFASVTRLWSSPQTSFSATAVAPRSPRTTTAPPDGHVGAEDEVDAGTDAGSVLVA